MIKRPFSSILSALALSSLCSFVHADIYEHFPITLSAYTGEKNYSESYGGQIAHHLLHNSLKKLSSRGTGEVNAELQASMMAYYSGTDKERSIIDPASKDGFPILQSQVDQLSTGENLSDKVYKGLVPGWPGNMTGSEVVRFMINKAAVSEGGYDPLYGYDYTQLISKFLMGAVFYNQAVDGYLDEKLAAEVYPNHKPYKDGTAYTGKEHVWDEAFGYFGAPTHTLQLSATDIYAIAKQKPEVFAKADYNGDGKISLYTEMAYAHAYYAASFDRGGKTRYLHDITQAFMDGRQLITQANGQSLSISQQSELQAYAATIKINWERVIAEAVFKYAGSVYADLQKLQIIIDSNGDAGQAYRHYVKHWGELKGFAMALQVGGKDLGETSVRLNRLIGYSPVLLGNTQVVGLSAEGQYQQASSISLGEYQVHMIKVQKLILDQFGIQARNQDVMDNMAILIEQLGNSLAAEND